MKSRSYYETLGVSREASAEDIKRAYRRLAREHHPDRNAGDTASEEKFKEVGKAFGVLSDPTKRRLYDEMGEDAERIGWDPDKADMYRRHGGARGRGGKGGAGVDLEDLFGGGFGGARPEGPQRGQDITTRIHIGFEEAVNGGERQVQLTKPTKCSTCSGRGTDPKAGPSTCRHCGGSGQVKMKQAHLHLGVPCPACSGSGQGAGPACGDCKGQGQVRRMAKLQVKIPPGVDTGQKIRLGGQGAPGKKGGPAGDLLIEVTVAAHPWFTRKGRDLYLDVPITLPEALVGADVQVPTLDGRVTLHVPAGTQNDAKLRLRGKGVPKSGKHEAGDLYAVLKVRLPGPKADKEAVAAAAEGLADLYRDPIRDW